jgi:hypothetical protein
VDGGIHLDTPDHLPARPASSPVNEVDVPTPADNGGAKRTCLDCGGGGGGGGVVVPQSPHGNLWV